jgi:release factor glutamine methyltransferase
VAFHEGDLLAPFDDAEHLGSIDLVTCNPPYISSGKVDTLPGEIIGHEPRLAFDGGPLGIRIVQRLVNEVPRFVRAGGWLAFEVGLGQGRGLRRRIEHHGAYGEVRDIADAEGQVRALAARIVAPGRVR